MRIAAIYDIHGNFPALEAVLQDVQRAGIDQVVVGGDIVPGPMPVETLTCLLDLDIPVRFLRGNGDREVLASMTGNVTSALPVQVQEVIRWSGDQFDIEYAQQLAAWPTTIRIEMAGIGKVLFCHATPKSDVAIFTRLTPEDRLLSVFDDLDAALVVCGHTHMQFDRMIKDVRVVNAGSVGMPFGVPGAYWLLLDTTVQLQHTTYDLEKAAERIRGTAYPQAEQFAAQNVLQPPSEEEMLERFAKVTLK